MVPTAVSIAMPTARYRRDRLAEWTNALASAVARVEQDLAAATPQVEERQSPGPARHETRSVL
jgi:hypothetical protein